MKRLATFLGFNLSLLLIVCLLVGVLAPDGAAAANLTPPMYEERIIFSYKTLEMTRYDLWSVNLDGSGLTNLTQTPNEDEYAPSVSPFSASVAYVKLHHELAANDGIYVMTVDGASPRQVVSRTAYGNSAVMFPVWKDAMTLVFTAETASCLSAVYTGNINTLETQQLFAMQAALGEGSGWVTDISPGGAEFAICAQQGCWSPTFDVYRSNIDGTLLQMLYGDTPDNWTDIHALWSPQGDRIAFTHWLTPGANNSTEYTAVTVMDTDGANLASLTSATEANFVQDWDPDGLRLLYLRLDAPYGVGPEARKGNLYVMNADGSGVTQVTSLDGWFPAHHQNSGGPWLMASWYRKSWGPRVYVDHEAVGAGDGTSWQDAFTTIQAAVDAVSDAGGGEVWVAEGTYTATSNPVLTMKENAHLYGGFIGLGAGGEEVARSQRDVGAHPTAIDGQNARRCVVGANNATLDGFSIINGWALGSGESGEGGGMRNSGASPIVANCLFQWNTGQNGGAMFNGSGAAPFITDCEFVNNGASFAGGAIAVGSSSIPTIGRTTFRGNTASAYGGAINIAVTGVSPTISECVFEDNVASVAGGAIVNYGGAHTFVSSTRFINNSTTGGGGAIWTVNGSNVDVVNCIFWKNQAANGGAIHHGTGGRSVVNCTFYGNIASAQGGGIENFQASPTITNCILWNNTGGDIVNGSLAAPEVTYCDVQDSLPGLGNISGDPLFIDTNTGDFRLRPGSPCIDAGRVIADLDADIEGTSRGYDGTAEPRGDGSDFDIGAYEWVYSAGLYDVNEDTLVNGVDLLIVWDAAHGTPSEYDTDVNDDGETNLLDVQLVFEAARAGTVAEDVNLDGVVDCDDVTLVQDALAGADVAPFSADADGGGGVNTIDLERVDAMAGGCLFAPGWGLITGSVIGAGKPVDNGAVRAVHVVSGTAAPAAVDPSGRYTIELMAGRHDLTAYSQGMVPKTQRITVPADETLEVHFSLERDMRESGVRGIVTDEATGGPIAGAQVIALLDAEVLAETFTDGEGAYELLFELPAKAAADVTIRIIAEGYGEFEGQVTVNPGQISEQSGALVKAAGPGALIGRVTNAVTGAPVAGALVTAKTAGYAMVAAVTNGAGEYLLVNLEEGVYAVEAGAANYLPRRNRNVVVGAGSPACADFRLEPASEAPELCVAPLDKWVTCKAQEVEVIVVNLGGGLISWSASITQGSEWLTIAKAAQGQNHGVIYLSCLANTGKTKREARVTVTAAEADGAEVVLTQARGEDVNLDGATDSMDVQLAILGALEIESGWDCDVDGNGRADSVDVQLAILAALE